MIEKDFASVEEMVEHMGEGMRASWPQYVYDRQMYGHDDQAHVAAWRETLKLPETPFRFEDLCGRCEPTEWGPVYPKTASAAVMKWRATAKGRKLTPEEAEQYGHAVHVWARSQTAFKRDSGAMPTTTNCASGQPYEFSAAKHRAKIAAECAAASAAAARLVTDKQLRAAYDAAMKAKREREIQLDFAAAA